MLVQIAYEIVRMQRGILYHRCNRQFVLASFKEIPDRNTAELFSKKAIQVRREDLEFP